MCVIWRFGFRTLVRCARKYTPKTTFCVLTPLSNMPCETKRCTVCPEKRDQNVFVICTIKLRRFRQNYVNVSHLTWVMSPLPCENLKCSSRTSSIELLDLTHLNYGLQIRQIWIQLITTCGIYCDFCRVYNTCITDLDLSTTPLMNGYHDDDMIPLIGPLCSY